ncbi:hypothetical protein C8P63_12419 [Melghirimyces profundicolus]|uniref:Uncharacterized protein n=1 Tax=Melghirimyces profundicolus TaxID=1242148 RepID=A0A2T6BD26_9BACL|nr:hypothetical protein [Melghirimyces profundicolus]PTX53963.1 hypothetical protein C8P63_12419 [Melghirimyces profundicolus]
MKPGRAAIPKDVARRLVKILDDPRFAFEIASEYTGCAWMRWLDGMDFHQSTVKEKALEAEGGDSQIRNTSLANRPEQADPKKLE